LSVQTGVMAGIPRVQFQVGTSDLRLFRKWPGCHIDHSPQTSAQVNEWSYTCAPPIRLHDMALLCKKNERQARDFGSQFIRMAH
jgi:hypothetical protein